MPAYPTRIPPNVPVRVLFRQEHTHASQKTPLMYVPLFLYKTGLPWHVAFDSLHAPVSDEYNSNAKLYVPRSNFRTTLNNLNLAKFLMQLLSKSKASAIYASFRDGGAKASVDLYSSQAQKLQKRINSLNEIQIPCSSVIQHNGPTYTCMKPT